MPGEPLVSRSGGDDFWARPQQGFTQDLGQVADHRHGDAVADHFQRRMRRFRQAVDS